MNVKGLWITDEQGGRRYRVLRILGSGGEGRLYVCRTPVDDGSTATLEVVVKEFPGDLVGDVGAWLARNDKLRHVRHPNLVRVRDVFLARPPSRADTDVPLRQPDSGYVVMDLVVGDSLVDLVAAEPAAPVNERLGQLAGVASALDALHSGDVAGTPLVHGDVTPSNILIDKHGTSILVDLEGMRAENGASLVALSRPYAAPELSETGFRPTPEADRYAFAATVAHVLLGAPPPLTDVESPTVGSEADEGRGSRRPRDEPSEALDPASSGSSEATAARSLDVPTMLADLAERPTVTGRQELLAELREALTAPPGQRPTSLTRWLTQLRTSGTLSSAVTVGRPEVATSVEREVSRDQRRRKLRVIGIAASAGLVLAVATTVVLVAAGLPGPTPVPAGETTPAPAGEAAAARTSEASAAPQALPRTIGLGPLEVEDQSLGDDGRQYGLSWSGPEGAQYLLLYATEDAGLGALLVGNWTGMSFVPRSEGTYCFQVVGIGQAEGLLTDARASDGSACTFSGQVEDATGIEPTTSPTTATRP